MSFLNNIGCHCHWQSTTILPIGLIFQHLELDYGGIHKDQMEKIQDFLKENKGIFHAPCTQSWHGLLRKAMILSWNNIWCNYNVQTKQDGVKDGRILIHHKSWKLCHIGRGVPHRRKD